MTDDRVPAGAASQGLAGEARESSAKRPSLARELALWSSGARCIAGIDEVGRGAWAGPLSVGVAVLSAEVTGSAIPRGLRDSKQLSEEARERIFPAIASWCVTWAVGHSEPSECDRVGMSRALSLAAERALGALPGDVTSGLSAILLDGGYDYATGALRYAGMDLVPVEAVVKGDSQVACIAAASILAKVTRDQMMRDLGRHFEAYDFPANKGYPSWRHVMAINGWGPSSIHRLSWSYMDKLPWDAGALRSTCPRVP